MHAYAKNAQHFHFKICSLKTLSHEPPHFICVMCCNERLLCQPLKPFLPELCVNNNQPGSHSLWRVFAISSIGCVSCGPNKSMKDKEHMRRARKIGKNSCHYLLDQKDFAIWVRGK